MSVAQKTWNVKRLDRLRLEQKVQEKALIPADILRQEIYIFIYLILDSLTLQETNLIDYHSRVQSISTYLYPF